jgi:hypothetical protein
MSIVCKKCRRAKKIICVAVIFLSAICSAHTIYYIFLCSLNYCSTTRLLNMNMPPKKIEEARIAYNIYAHAALVERC